MMRIITRISILRRSNFWTGRDLCDVCHYCRQFAEGIEEAGYGASVHEVDEQGEVELVDPGIKAAKVCDTIVGYRRGSLLYYTEYTTGGDGEIGW